MKYDKNKLTINDVGLNHKQEQKRNIDFVRTLTDRDKFMLKPPKTTENFAKQKSINQ